MGTVRLNQPIVDDLSVVGLALSVDVGSLLVGDTLVISISGIELSSMTLKDLFTPSIVSFSYTSSFGKGNLTYLPVLAGSYRLNVTVSGGL
jgi:hypothetical protein